MKRDWARKAAQRIVAGTRPVGQYFQTEDEFRDESRVAAALRRAYRKGFQDGEHKTALFALKEIARSHRR